MTVPTYLPYYVLGGIIAVLALVLVGLSRALWRADWPATAHRSAVRATATVLLAWFGVTLILASSEFYRGASSRVPTIEYGILVPVLIGAWLIWRLPAMSRLIDAVPQHWIVALQFYRALGVIFLLLYASGQLPGIFALPAGAGDIAVGLSAPIVGFAGISSRRTRTGAVLAWNLLGLVDLAIAITTGFLSSPSPLQLFAFDQPNELITTYPLVLVPVFLVPLSILLHLASLMKLARGGAATASGPAVLAGSGAAAE